MGACAPPQSRLEGSLACSCGGLLQNAIAVLSCSEDIILPRSSLLYYFVMVPNGREDSLL